MSPESQRNVLLEVASLSMRLARKYVEPDSHRNSPQNFTQAQLLSCLILRAYLKTTYRGLIEILGVSDGLRDTLGLRSLPHDSTLKRFADRSSVLEVIDAMLLELVRQCDGDSPEEAAIDATGMETTSASAHYLTRSGKRRSKYVKLSVCVMAGSLLPSSVVASWGPNNDKADAPELLARASTVSQRKKLFGDVGYDAEWGEEFCRDDWQVESIIKLAVHRSNGRQNSTYVRE